MQAAWKYALVGIVFALALVGSFSTIALAFESGINLSMSGTPITPECVNPANPCPCKMKPDKEGKCTLPGDGVLKCVCKQSVPGGTVTGFCGNNIGYCQGTNAPGQDGKNALDQGLSKLGEMLGKIMEMMKKDDKGGEQPQPQPNTGTGTGCTTFRQAVDAAEAQKDPCTYAPNGVSGGLTGTGGSSVSDLLNSLNGGSDTGGTNSDVSSLLGGTTGTSSNTGGTNNDNPITTTNTGGKQSSNISTPEFTSTINTLGKTGTVGGTGSVLNFTSPQDIVQSIVQKNIQPGAYGDIKILENGTTIVGGMRGANSETAGFYGVSGGTTGMSAIARVCATRPWATNFLSYIIPPSFFDSLCTWRGHTVGVKTKVIPPSTTIKTTVPAKPKTKATTTVATTSNAIQARVDIWASPATVPLGARTSIFWNTQGVTECVETSPDGSFSQNTLKGGASTVALTKSTVYTISCIGPDGTPITDNVTVLISI